MNFQNQNLINSRPTVGGIFSSYTETLVSDNITNDNTDILLNPNRTNSGNVVVDPTDTLKVNNISPASGSTVTINGLVATYPIVMPDNIQVNTINEKTLNGQLLLQTTGTNNVGIENFTFKDDLLSNVNDLTISTSGTTKNINITPTGNINLNGTTKVDTINENTLNSQLTIQTTGTNSVNIKSGSDHVDIQEDVHIYDKTYNNKFIDLFYDGLTDAGSIFMYDGNHSMNLCGGSSLLNGAYINLATGTSTKDVYFGCDHIYFKNNASTAYYGKFDSAGLSVDTINEYTLNGQLVINTTGTNDVKVENTEFKDDIIKNITNDLTIQTTGVSKDVKLTPSGKVLITAPGTGTSFQLNDSGNNLKFTISDQGDVAGLSSNFGNVVNSASTVGRSNDASFLNISGGLDVTGGYMRIFGKSHPTKANYLELTNLSIFPSISAGTLVTFAGLTAGNLLASGLPTLSLISDTNTNRIPYSNGATLADSSTFTYDATTLTIGTTTINGSTNTLSASDTLNITTTGTTKNINIQPTGDTFIEDILNVYKTGDNTKYLKLFYNSALERPSVGTDVNTHYLELIGGHTSASNSNITMGYNGSSVHFTNCGTDTFNIGSIGVADDYAIFNSSNVVLKKPLQVNDIGTVSGDLNLAPVGDTFVEESLKVYETSDKTKFISLLYDTVNSKSTISTSSKTTAPLVIIGGPTLSTDPNLSMGYSGALNYITNAADIMNFGTIGVGNDIAVFDASNITLKKSPIFSGVSNGAVISGGWLGLDTSNNVVKNNPLASLTLPIGSITTANNTYIPYSNGTNLIESANLTFLSNSLVLSNGLGTDNYKPFFATAGSLGSNKMISMELDRDGTHYGYSGYLYNATTPQLFVGLVDGSNTNAIQMYLDKVNTGPQLNISDSSTTTTATLGTFYQSAIASGTISYVRVGKDVDNCVRLGYEHNSTDTLEHMTISRRAGGVDTTKLELASDYLYSNNELSSEAFTFSTYPAPVGSGVLLYIETVAGSHGYQIHRDASSRKYKNIIGLSKHDFYSTIDQLKLTEFTFKGSKETKIGLIAEEIDEVKYWDECTIYKDGQPEAIHHDGIMYALIDCVQKQKKEIEELKKEIVQLKINKVRTERDYTADILELQSNMNLMLDFAESKKNPKGGQVAIVKKIKEMKKNKTNLKTL